MRYPSVPGRRVNIHVRGTVSADLRELETLVAQIELSKHSSGVSDSDVPISICYYNAVGRPQQQQVWSTARFGLHCTI
jgi:hypothetical protein